MELPAVSTKKRKGSTGQMGMMKINSFTKPEMEAALLLIQLSSDSDRRSSTTTTKSGGGDDDEDDFRLLIKGMDETQKQEVEHSQGSCNDDSNNDHYYNNHKYSDVTSAMSATAGMGPLAEKDLEVEDEDENENDVACGPRRKIKKFRSLEELYRLTEPL